MPMGWRANGRRSPAASASVPKVSTVSIITDKYSGEPRGFAFVEMPTKAEAIAAISGLNGQDLNGRALNVNEAKPRTEGGGGGNRGGGGGGYRKSY